MKHVQKFAAAILALTVVGCGGSGNGTPTASIAGATPRVEAIVQVLRTNLMHPGVNPATGQLYWTDAQLLNPQTPGLQADLINQTVFGIQDPTNIQCNEQLVFQLVNYSADGTRNIIPATFTSSDTGGLYGNLSGNTGVYLAGNSPTPPPSPTTGSLSVTATADGQTYSTFYNIKVDQVRLIGSVSAPGATQSQLNQILVEFFNASGGLVDTVTVATDGTFRASVPTVATSFTVVADTIPSAFYQSYSYGGNQYTAGLVTCFAGLPTGLIAGATVLPSTVSITPRVAGQGTPTPTGCSDALPAKMIKRS